MNLNYNPCKIKFSSSIEERGGGGGGGGGGLFQRQRLGKLLRDWMERIWAFPSALIPY